MAHHPALLLGKMDAHICFGELGHKRLRITASCDRLPSRKEAALSRILAGKLLIPRRFLGTLWLLYCRRYPRIGQR